MLARMRMEVREYRNLLLDEGILAKTCASRTPELRIGREVAPHLVCSTHMYAEPARLARVGVMCSALALVASCNSAPADRVARSSSFSLASTSASPWSCPVSDKLVPACGALWGVTTPAPNSADLERLEREVGRSFNFVYRFHDINDVIPTQDERRLVDEGKILHITIESRDFADPDRTSVPWASVARGDFDSHLIAQAKGIASLKVPVYLTFDHEPDQQPKTALGTGADYIRAWRHVYNLFLRAGATNAVWVWVITGWQPALSRAATMWPGNKYVDWISWEAYNQSGCQGGHLDPSQFTSFGTSIENVYNWVHSVGPTIGMDPNKPMMISEAGSVLYPDDPALTANWYAAIPKVLARYPQIKAIGLWDHTGSAPSCDFRVDRNAAVLAAVRAAGNAQWVTIDPHVATSPPKR